MISKRNNKINEYFRIKFNIFLLWDENFLEYIKILFFALKRW